jgi:alkylation response protein AidB-like acyl-CoA dehydrogenase
MEFDFSEEERAFEKEVELFLAENASPDVMDPLPEQLSQTVDTPAKRAFMRKLSERGWLGMSWPKEYGGQQRSGIYDFLLTEALSRHGAPQPGKGVGIVGKTIIRHGSDKLKKEFLPKIIRGEIEFAIGYSEPQAGSDAAAMALAAQRHEDLDHLGSFRRLVLAGRAHRCLIEAQGDHAVPVTDGRPRPDDPGHLDDRRRAHQSGLFR